MKRIICWVVGHGWRTIYRCEVLGFKGLMADWQTCRRCKSVRVVYA